MAPILGMIKESFSLNSTQAGILQTLPLLAFAIFSPFAAGVANKFSIEKVLFATLIIIMMGIIYRSLGGIVGIYTGTLIIGLGIAFANVLLPSILKRDFPHKVASLTGLYALTMGIAAAIGSTMIVPLAHIPWFGWNYSLLLTLIFPFIAAIIWLPQLKASVSLSNNLSNATYSNSNVWRSPLAWQVTLFLGLNSLIYYIVVTWLPTILIDRGFSAEHAGSLHGALQLSTALPGLFIGPLLGRMRDQRVIAVLVSLMAASGVSGLMMFPAQATFWIILFGVGSGSTIILGLAFISLRSSSGSQAASLSGMAQCIGYLLAAGGPPAVGLLHDVIHSWALPLTACAVLSLLMAVVGYLSGRNKYLNDGELSQNI